MGGGDAGARRSLCAAMDVDVVHPAMAVAKDEGDLELKRIAMEFLSHYCSATPSVMSGAVHGEADKKQKRSATQSFLVPCSNASAKKQCVAHCGEGLEALKDVGHKTSFQEQCGTHYGGSEALEIVQPMPAQSENLGWMLEEIPRSASTLKMYFCLQLQLGMSYLEMTPIQLRR